MKFFRDGKDIFHFKATDADLDKALEHAKRDALAASFPPLSVNHPTPRPLPIERHTFTSLPRPFTFWSLHD